MAVLKAERILALSVDWLEINSADRMAILQKWF
jgi:hypothetical protein